MDFATLKCCTVFVWFCCTGGGHLDVSHLYFKSGLWGGEKETEVLGRNFRCSCFLSGSYFPLAFLTRSWHICLYFFSYHSFFSPFFPLAVAFISFHSQDCALVIFIITRTAWRKECYAFAHLWRLCLAVIGWKSHSRCVKWQRSYLQRLDTSCGPLTPFGRIRVDALVINSILL